SAHLYSTGGWPPEPPLPLLPPVLGPAPPVPPLLEPPVLGAPPVPALPLCPAPPLPLEPPLGTPSGVASSSGLIRMHACKSVKSEPPLRMRRMTQSLPLTERPPITGPNAGAISSLAAAGGASSSEEPVANKTTVSPAAITVPAR